MLSGFFQPGTLNAEPLNPGNNKALRINDRAFLIIQKPG